MSTNQPIRCGSCEVSEYKGKAMILLNPDRGPTLPRFQFGVAKAKLAVEHAEAIQAFAAGEEVSETGECYLSEYLGHPILVLEPISGPKFSFGKSKAHVVLAKMEDLRTFISNNQE